MWSQQSSSLGNVVSFTSDLSIPIAIPSALLGLGAGYLMQLICEDPVLAYGLGILLAVFIWRITADEMRCNALVMRR